MDIKGRICRSAILGICASAAFFSALVAGANASESAWYTGKSLGSMVKLTGSRAVTASLAESHFPFVTGPEKGKHGVAFQFGWIEGTTQLLFTASGAECINCTITNEGPGAGSTEQSEGTGARGGGTIVLTGVKALAPTGCEVIGYGQKAEPGKLVSKPLYWNASGNTETFVPKSGATTVFFSFSLNGSGCSTIAGAYNVTGSLMAEAFPGFGTASVRHELVFGGERGYTGLHISSFGVEMQGTLIEQLSSGEFWQAK